MMFGLADILAMREPVPTPLHVRRPVQKIRIYGYPPAVFCIASLSCYVQGGGAGDVEWGALRGN